MFRFAFEVSGKPSGAQLTGGYLQPHNKGSSTFDAANMTSNNLSYGIATTARVYLYVNSNLDDSLEAPITFSLPVTNSTAPYKLAGSDSIYFSPGTMFTTNGGQQATVPGGAKLKFEGDKLLLTSNHTERKTVNMQGMRAVADNQARVVITMQKQ